MKRHSTMLHAQQAKAAKLDAANTANLPVRRSGSEGGKELAPNYCEWLFMWRHATVQVFLAAGLA
jgi:hypothetical protein